MVCVRLTRCLLLAAARVSILGGMPLGPLAAPLAVSRLPGCRGMRMTHPVLCSHCHLPGSQSHRQGCQTHVIHVVGCWLNAFARAVLCCAVGAPC